MATIQDLVLTASKVKEVISASLNPLNYLEKLLDSHGFHDRTQPASNFLYQLTIHTDDFFDAKNMPEKWSHRTYSSSMESLYHVLQESSLKTKLQQDMGEEFDTLLDVVQSKKKHYMNEVKKEGRRKKRDETMDGDDDVQTLDAGSEQGGMALASQMAVVVTDPPMSTQGGTPKLVVTDDVVHNEESTTNTNSKKKLKKHAHHLKWLLDRYAELEQDPFKRLILDLVKQEADSISQSISHLT